jgi:hypothetical protein
MMMEIDMAHAENTYNGFQYLVRTLAKQGVGTEHLQLFGFDGFVTIPREFAAEKYMQIPVKCLEKEGYRRENWALDAATDEAKAIIDGKRAPKDEEMVR